MIRPKGAESRVRLSDGTRRPDHPPARKAGYLVAFADLRSQLALLHTNRSAAAEPANVFHLFPMEPAR